MAARTDAHSHLSLGNTSCNHVVKHLPNAPLSHLFWASAPSSQSQSSPMMFYCFHFLAALHTLWGLRSPTKDQTHVPCIGGTESSPLERQGSLSYNVLSWYFSLAGKLRSRKLVVTMIQPQRGNDARVWEQPAGPEVSASSFPRLTQIPAFPTTCSGNPSIPDIMWFDPVSGDRDPRNPNNSEAPT